MSLSPVLKETAAKSRDKKASFGQDLDLSQFKRQTKEWSYDPGYQSFDDQEREHLLRAGIELTDVDHAGTFLQADRSIMHCKTSQPGLEILPIKDALQKYDGLKEYYWQLVAVDADKYTAAAELALDNGYFIRALPGARISQPVEACLYIRTEGAAQHVHNIVVAEPGSHLHIITGCTTHPGVTSGLHLGISEFFVKKGAHLTFTMVHNWAENIHVRPRSAIIVEEGGVYISNYIVLKPVKSVQMYPTARLIGEGAVARMNSVVVGHPGTELDLGGRVFLEAPNTKAEVIARTVTTGGTVISRGHLIGKVPQVKAHLECRGLILAPKGIIYAVPELTGEVAGVEMSHEAAVGRIAQEEIEYLMARGLTEEEAASTIVRGFLNVEIEGLPQALRDDIERTIQETEKGL
ncbi:SufB/SufD family protein [Desulfobacca acetoxidans]|uniref:SufBD protein n=1 Tax=Desulfobacca acetoxidans (strain ATCC 700848 / DSM 11109 / ASRB2) TaxID=880072 RepID=F2NH99_DESAR|nr:SufD family Fe-S cluster assembly protein [Desulfobacca acetoxidans]AEB08941.1 SufBD protein [Desulfobacca acetoxidans DSM 11109]